MPEPSTAPRPPGSADLSVVVAVRNAEAVLAQLFDRLYAVLDELGVRYEAVFVDDASRDRSATLLRQQHRLRPDRTRVLFLSGGPDQQAAIAAGLAACAGRRVVILDAGPGGVPEEIPVLLAELERGHDLVVARRGPPRARTWGGAVLRLSQRLRDWVTGDGVPAEGSPLQAYERGIIDAILACERGSWSVAALAGRFAANPGEILVGDDWPEPVYLGLYRDFDAATRSSLVPLRAVSLAGFAGAVGALGGALYMALVWLAAEPAVEGYAGVLVWLFLLLGVLLVGMALQGIYLGRVVEQTQGRVRPLVREELSPRRSTGRTKA